MKRLLTIVLLLVPWALWAQEITLLGPDAAIMPREQVVLRITGLTAAELPLATPMADPSEGTTLIPAQFWGGQPILIFASRSPGKFTVSVSVKSTDPLPEWLTGLTTATDAVVAANVDLPLTEQLVSTQKSLFERYSRRTGSCVVEVAGTLPPPEPKPDPTTKVTMVTYVFEKDQNLVPSGVAVALQKISSQGILATDFEQNTTSGSTRKTPTQYVIALAKAQAEGLPCLVVQSGNSVLRVVKSPKTVEEVMEAIKP